MSKVYGSVEEQVIGELRRYSINWNDTIGPDNPAYPPLTRERISSVTWALDPDSPAAGVNIVSPGYDDGLAVTWCSIESDGTIVDTDIIYLNCTIETTGLQPFGDLEEQTSAQRITRQLRIRFRAC